MDSNNINFFKLILDATPIVQIVILILAVFSIISWAIIIQKSRSLNIALKNAEKFEDKFWAGEDLNRMYEGLTNRSNSISGAEQIFYIGFKEFNRLQHANPDSTEYIIKGTLRAMNLTMNRELDEISTRIPFLSTVASSSPYIGLFGTVFGIMHVFIALGGTKQATLQMVAPGIAEALITTAIGLFAAIPAVIAYNQLTFKLNKLEQNYINFIDEFTTILNRQAIKKNNNSAII